MATIRVESLSKVYGTSSTPGGGVMDASCTLPSGTFFTLLGPSGCGKTTTLRCIAGLERPDSGSILVDNTTFFDSKRSVSMPLNERRLGMVFQSYAIWPHMSVFDNVAFPMRVSRKRRYNSVEITRAVSNALEVVGLTDFGKRSATQLSGGQQQRIALARAIVTEPRILLLDEPLSNLDATLREAMRRELKRLQRQLGVTTIYVTHDQTEALEMSDQIAILNKGRILQQGSPKEIYYDPADAFVADFIGQTNLLRGTVEDYDSDSKTGGIRLVGGQFVRCRFRSPIAVGSSAVMSVRPEVMRFSHMSNGYWTNTIDGILISETFSGSTYSYLVDVAGHNWVVVTNVAAGVDSGSKVTLNFDAASGICLASPNN